MKNFKSNENSILIRLRKVLMKDLKAYRAGDISSKQAQTVCRFSDSIVRTMQK